MASSSAQDITPGDVPEEGVAPNKPVSRFTRWYRSPLFSVILAGLISFTQPGIWNALNSERSGNECKKDWFADVIQILVPEGNKSRISSTAPTRSHSGTEQK